MRRALLVLLLLPLLATQAQPPSAATCYDLPTSPPPLELPRCGDGVLDAGEMCDDGNQVDGDGCSAFCSHFDYAPAAATLAGGPTSCPNGRTILGGPTGSVQFCALSAIEASPDGSFVLLADGGQLLRYDLFTDAAAGSIQQLSVGIQLGLVRVCSIGALSDGSGAFLLHDCGASRMYLGSSDRGQLVADLSGLIAPTLTNFKAYYDRQAAVALVAGIPIDYSASTSAANSICVAVHRVNASDSTTSLFATIPCTAYGVWEGGTRVASFDMRDMQPYLIALNDCPATFRAGGKACYYVYLQRHMEFVQAVIAADGGFDLRYYSSTTNLYDNALGAPFVRVVGGMTYTLRGACLQMQSRLVTSSGRTPPPVSLGNACRRTPQLGLRCATPLNNPFITDVLTSPVLVPDALSVTHSHSDLTAILAAGCPALANVSTAGPLLYRSILAGFYGNTTPVDFVELPSTRDIIYITPTAVGLVSTKGILFQDRAQPGYARATNLIYCHPQFFGFVGTVCRPCNDTAAPGYYTSVAWQIQCVASDQTGGGGGVSAPFETFTVLASYNVSAETVRIAVCLFTQSKGGTCPETVGIQPPQPYNVAADTLQSLLLAGGGASAKTSFMACLMQTAQSIAGRSFAPVNPVEYNTRVISPGLTIRSATANRFVVADPQAAAANLSLSSDTATAIAQRCYGKLSRGMGAFLACAAPYTAGATTARRRLLQQQQQTDAPTCLTEHQGVSMASSTPVSWNRALPNSFNNTATTGTGNSNAQQPIVFPVWVGVAVGASAAVVVVGLFLFMYCGGHVAPAAVTAAPFRSPRSSRSRPHEC